jgi:hypothetical protein
MSQITIDYCTIRALIVWTLKCLFWIDEEGKEVSEVRSWWQPNGY